MTVQIRSGRDDDIGAVLALWLAADAEPTHTDDEAGVATLLAHDDGALVVAEDDSRIVGSVIAGWDGWRGSIYRLVVAPDHRRSGLGGALLAAAERRLEELGGRRLQAIVVESDAQATGFWRASGWVEQSDRVRFVKG
jgi:ribosomal protein S18 acetylase RimI-like enzyme